MSRVVDEHRRYLSDHVRLAAFRDAIREVVTPGCVVVDLGSGTGILGFMACEAGARHVYVIERGGMIEVARAVGRANGFGDRLTFLAGVSRELTLPERADVIVADQIGHFGFEAGLVEDFADARARFLKPGGRLLPVAVDLLVAPVEHADAYGWIDFWQARPAGFDFAAAREWAVNTGYPTIIAPSHLLAPPAVAGSFDLATVTGAAWVLEASFVLDRAGTMHGVAGAFTARLAPGTTLSNSPLAAPRLARRNVFFPLEHPVDVGAGDRVQIVMRIRPVERLVAWRVDVRAGDGSPKAGFRQSTLDGMLVRREDLARLHPDYVPNLTPRGEARRSVLELCDGRHSLAEIEREVYERHPALFRSRAEASAFVAEVVTGYTQ